MRNVLHHRAQRFAPLALVALLAAAPPLASARLAEPAAPSKPNSTRISASLKYTNGSKSEIPVWSDIRVTIRRDDVELTKEERLPADASASYLSPPALVAVDLDDDYDPEVLVDVFAAGDTCCRRTVVYHRTGDRYAPQVLEWDKTGYRLLDVTGGDSPEFVSSDGRFADLFQSDEPGPIRIQRLAGGRVQDISADAPKQLRRDARTHKRAWKRSAGDGRGDPRPAIAAYVVDLVRLGEVREARRVIAKAARQHDLKASANAFARQLDQRMVAWGYFAKAKLGRVR